jgi:hypothetical protein
MEQLIERFKEGALEASLSQLPFKWVQNALESSQMDESTTIDLLLKEKFKTL